ncbi:hypothetical protein KD159_16540, partial [Escherichia coli]|nr:hypothetical protein [Escherichia coli]
TGGDVPLRKAEYGVLSLPTMIGEDPFIYSCEYLTFSECWAKNIAKSGAGTQNRIECCGEEKCRSV